MEEGYLLGQEKHIKNEVLQKNSLYRKFGVKSQDFRFSIPKQNSKSHL